MQALMNRILFDGRWQGTHGIGRFSTEILSRLQQVDVLKTGPKPLSLKNMVWQPYQLSHYKNQYDVFFTPGFNPVLHSPIPFAMTIHDLIHLEYPGKNALAKRFFYETL